MSETIQAQEGIGTVASTEAPAAVRTVPLSRGLSTKLLLLTIVFVLLAEVLIFLPWIASYRLNWLKERLSTAAAVSIVLVQGEPASLSRTAQNDVLMAIGAKAIAVRDGGVSRLLVVAEMPPKNNVSSAPVMPLIMPDNSLRNAMLRYSRNVAFVSLLISLFTAMLVYAAIDLIMIGPIRTMTRSMLSFSEAPDDPGRIIHPAARADEIGVAERELSQMQERLQKMLSEQKHLADLGLAVSKINHDMRNILASAQLMSDRLRQVKDPTVQAFAPKLLRALDRAVSYSEGVLHYGRTQEPPPARRRLRLRQLVEDVQGLLDIEQGIEFVNSVEPAFEVDADSDQLFRVLTNLCRNSVQAMAADSENALVRRLAVSAVRLGSVSRIAVSDTGPGLPPKARENLFAAFRGSARSGGTGLGLAIAHELIRAHGGTVELVESIGGRTTFAVTIPDQPVRLDQARNSLRRPA
ncbi:HAMP domain-containing histidine kinase [Mesorhizobium sp. M7A.F.Ca.CA.004.01.1.1]|uniref:ATP-binding protein n=1 Tax=Mesorhizobium sp. M7A.F.Ca.CA.004.01.1.1 TaxID=2496689 RepID=UPI000FCC291A|nr:HAMP domain-containing sensor histidine kinase [Mesorhizobium sp. M7A.F.Ca.CA.004.01.1.1]RVB00227.1 HAMP domain-containing histidine kinase [Mesorhizobium sp. M7A.F.Ca.CA.004.01.1.1]